MHQLLAKLDKEEQKKLQKKKMPLFTEPMLAKLTHNYFSDPDWIFERKLDGERCLVFKKGKEVSLKSRNNKKLNASYPEVEAAFKKMAIKNVILDGEVVAFDGNVTSFSKLQARLGLESAAQAQATGVPVYYYVFDILYLDGYDLTKLSLETRKTLLKKAVTWRDPIRFSTHRNEKGEKYYKEACKEGWEGVIAKKRSSTYEHKRSSNWLKFKCVNEQELVIGGYTDPQGSRIGFGALLLGYYKNKELHYAGKVGTGFDDKTLKDLYKKLSKLERKTNPFSTDDMKDTHIHWVKPELVAQIGFTEWTRDNKLRHPRYLGLRRDKKAKDVIKES